MSSSRAKNEPTKSGRNRPQLQPSEPESPERPGANEEMLRSIKVMMDDQRTEIVAKFESIISELSNRCRKKSPCKVELLVTWSAPLMSTRTS